MCVGADVVVLAFVEGEDGVGVVKFEDVSFALVVVDSVVIVDDEEEEGGITRDNDQAVPEWLYQLEKKDFSSHPLIDNRWRLTKLDRQQGR